MAICNFLFYFVVLFLSCYSKKPYVFGAREVANHHHVVQMRSLVPAASTCSASNKGSKGIQVYHRNGPCSPLGQENSSLLQDQSTVNFINSKSSNKYSVDNNVEGTKLPISNTSIGGYNFVVTVGFGTPKKELTLILDTGSDVTWIKCKPCSVHCNSQPSDIYDPNASSTFSTFPCSGASCNYSVNYEDHSYSEGYYVQDTVTLSSSDVYPKFVFGCGQDNSEGFGKAAGMLGIGRDSGLGHTFISQITKKNSKIFCYCLPAKENSMGYLFFGDEALKECQTNKFTQLLKNPHPYYFVNLIGITFGSQRLNISSYVPSSSGTVLDSGTVITRLPSSVYSAIRSAFQKTMSKYSPAQPHEVLDTCYNLKGHKKVTIPKMLLHFANADVELDQSAVIWKQSDAQVCLAFAGKDDESPTIIGNHQQRGLNILYDIQKGRVQFGDGRTGCAK